MSPFWISLGGLASALVYPLFGALNGSLSSFRRKGGRIFRPLRAGGQTLPVDYLPQFKKLVYSHFGEKLVYTRFGVKVSFRLISEQS